MFLRKHTDILIIVLLVIASRLPYLSSPDLMLDGDESIVGLMSKHFIEGKGVPLFFYGQSYGFSFIEVLFISSGYLVAGVSDYVVKVSMLSLWIIGVVFFYKTALTVCKGNKPAAMVVVLLLILTPAWLLWSMKARGGYITAFTLSSLTLYLSLNNHNSKIKWLSVGVLSVIIFYSQPLWLPGLLPFVVYALIKDRTVKQLMFFVNGCIVTILLFQLVIPDNLGLWQPTVLSIPDMNGLSIFVKSIYSNFGGHYYLQEAFEQPLLVTINVWVFLLGTIVSIAYAVVALFKHKLDPLQIAALASMLCCLCYLFFIDLSSIRYVLPAVGYILLFMSIIWRDHILKPIVFSPVFVLLIAGVFSLNKFNKEYHNQQQKTELLSCIDSLNDRGITHVYCNGPLEQWDIAFYSKEEVIPRYFYTVDRYQPYVRAVDSVYRISPKNVALLGLGYGDVTKGAVQINSKFYIIPQPDIELLKNRSFDIQ